MICRGRHKAHVADKHGTKQLDAKTAVLLLLILPDSLGEAARIANAQLASVQVFDSSCMPSHRKILLAANSVIELMTKFVKSPIPHFFVFWILR